MRVAASCLLLLLVVVGASAGQDTNFSSGPQYLMSYGSQMFLHSITTPSLSWQSPPLDVGASNATSGLSAGADISTGDSMPEPAHPADLFPIYYGVPQVEVIEVSLRGYEGESQLERTLPTSITDAGTWQMTTVQTLGERGYGVSLVEAAAYWKTHMRRATRVYGNSDIERLRQSS